VGGNLKWERVNSPEQYSDEGGDPSLTQRKKLVRVGTLHGKGGKVSKNKANHEEKGGSYWSKGGVKEEKGRSRGKKNLRSS